MEQDIKIFGKDYPTDDGTCVRDYVHINDLCNAHSLALKRMQETGESASYNLGNGNGFSVQQVVDIAKQVTGKDFTVVEDKKREGDPAVLVADSTRARAELEWTPKYDKLETIIETAWNWEQSFFNQ